MDMDSIVMGHKILHVVRTLPVFDFDGRTGMRSVWYLPDGAAIHAIERDPIPLGTYFLRPDKTGKHRNWVIECVLATRVAVEARPGSVERTEVEVHAGNTLKDTDACVIPGLGVGPNSVRNSRSAIETMRRSLFRDVIAPLTWILQISGNA